MSKEVIILGSARSNGDTRQFIDHVVSKQAMDIIDLKPLNISHFDYEYKNANDDFLTLITKVISNYDTVILATPIYWYTMSGIMKMFLDRISDLLYHHKDLGRQLRGKSLGVISSTNYSEASETFEVPFRETAKYLGMNYVGHCHGLIKEGKIEVEIEKRIEKFLVSVNDKTLV